jgi:hypothetical protein
VSLGRADLGKRGIPPSPRYIGIFDLGGKRDLIYGAQSLAGKILCSQDLGPVGVPRDVPPPP